MPHHGIIDFTPVTKRASVYRQVKHHTVNSEQRTSNREKRRQITRSSSRIEGSRHCFDSTLVQEDKFINTLECHMQRISTAYLFFLQPRMKTVLQPNQRAKCPNVVRNLYKPQSATIFECPLGPDVQFCRATTFRHRVGSFIYMTGYPPPNTSIGSPIQFLYFKV